MRIFVLLAALIALVNTGCFSSRDLSNEARFSKSVGKTMELRRPMLVTAGGNWFFPNSAYSIHTVNFCLEEVDDEYHKDSRRKIYGTLPIGHKVTITSVTEEYVGPDHHSIVAYGSTEMPFASKRQTFAYDWGCFTANFTTSKKAPWETDTVPE